MVKEKIKNVEHTGAGLIKSTNRVTHLFIVLITLSITSCTKKSPSQNIEAIGLMNSSIIVTRPQSHETQVAVIRLKLPSLFEASQKVKGKVLIDPRLAQAVMAEQRDLAVKLKNISPTIQVLYSYKYVLNALAVIIPGEFVDKVKVVAEKVGSYEVSKPFAKLPQSKSLAVTNKFSEFTSTNFIGSKAAHDLGIKGQNIRVGIIDTGIDYTHSMLGGTGSQSDYKSVDPNKDSEFFPNAKVVGGVDLVGSKYDASSTFAKFYVPFPDYNPIDEAGHGSHVAGTVAGTGDTLNSYDGVAPEANLYSIKVFGETGSTSNAVVIAGLEYAADPNQDFDLSDKLDVVNLSLGSGFGTPHVLYSAAVKNLVKGGVIFVASAGNSGPIPFVVGAPGTSTEGISVAASVDNMEHNWRYDAVTFDSKDGTSKSPLVEATFTTPVSELGDISGVLVPAGIAAKDYTQEEREKLLGNVALIDRGTVAFYDKVKRAFDAGAIGVVVANNEAGEPFVMGGGENSPKLSIPAVMVTQAVGDNLKEKITQGDSVVINFNTEEVVETPEKVDTITSFSSQGPRSSDYLLKPEITAPGQLIVSAKSGGGSETVAMDGTSMSGPHIAGVMALLRQRYPDKTVDQLKSIAMGTSKSISDENGNEYSLTRQGAGRVQVDKAIDSAVLVTPHSLSLGRTNLDTMKGIRKTVTVENISGVDKFFTFEGVAKSGMKIFVPGGITIPAGQTVEVPITVAIEKKDAFIELYEGRFNILENGKQVWTTPILLAAQMISKNVSSELSILATGPEDAQGAAVQLMIENKGTNEGLTLPFNLLATDGKKQSIPMENHFRSRYCDLESVGYRLAKDADGEEYIQFGVKLHNPITTWTSCEISIQIDVDNDNVADQELVGIPNFNLEGLGGALPANYYSFLLDAAKAREIRKTYESFKDFGAALNYIPSILDVGPMVAFEQSTSAMIQIKRNSLALNENNNIRIKVGTLSMEQDAIESDDFINGKKEWLEVNPTEQGMGYIELPQAITVPAGKKVGVSFTKGGGNQKLLLLHPTNNTVLLDSSIKDTQSEILETKYAF